MDRDFVFEEGCILTEYRGNQQVVTIPSNTLGIVGAFRYNTNLRSVYINNNLIISENTFRDCTALSSVNILADCLSGIGENAFRDCTALDSIDIPGVLLIEENAFRDCTRLSKVTIGGCSELKDYAFRGCTRLTSFTINDKYTNFGIDVFADCHNVTLYVQRGSTAEKYAHNNHIDYRYI